MNTLYYDKGFWKDGVFYVPIFIEQFAATVNVEIQDINNEDCLSDFAILSLQQIERISNDSIQLIKSKFWEFALICMENTHYGSNNLIKGNGESYLNWNKRFLGIYEPEDALKNAKIKYADTSNDCYGGFVSGINNSFKLWFETSWDNHMTVVIFENGKIVDFENA
jgi:hypothetical protein